MNMVEKMECSIIHIFNIRVTEKINMPEKMNNNHIERERIK